MPLAILATRYSGSYELLHAGFAIPVAVLLGAVAIGLARGALRLDDMRLGRAGGRRLARLGRALGVLGISLAATCAVALAVYGHPHVPRRALDPVRRRRMTSRLPDSCSRSAPACARRASASTSSSRSSKSATKVRAKYLRYLEEERFEQLPGHAYTKGFLQVYADALGLDGRLYVEEYNLRYVGGGGAGAGAPRVSRVPRRPPAAPPRTGASPARSASRWPRSSSSRLS